MGKGKLQVGESVTILSVYSKELESTEGRSISLAQFRDKQPVVLFFFPRANTSGCTAEVCAFRDEYERFQTAGAQVLGISGDSVSTLQDFGKKQSTPYPLLSDQGQVMRKGLGVKGNLLGMVPGRETFVISKDGTILLTFNDQLHPKRHVDEALRVLSGQTS